MPDIDLAIHLDRFVRSLHASLSQRAKEFDKDKVGPGGAMLLLKLSELGSAPLGTLAATLVRDKSQLTREVASLERKGMLTRAPCPVDARSSILSLTSKGRGLVERHQTELAAILKEMLADLSAQDVERLTNMLAKARLDEARNGASDDTAMNKDRTTAT